MLLLQRAFNVMDSINFINPNNFAKMGHFQFREIYSSKFKINPELLWFRLTLIRFVPASKLIRYKIKSNRDLVTRVSRTSSSLPVTGKF